MAEFALAKVPAPDLQGGFAPAVNVSHAPGVKANQPRYLLGSLRPGQQGAKLFFL